MKRLRAIDLCAGGGGWACAARGLPIDILLAVDLWEPACRTYKLNFPSTRLLEGDLRDEGVRAQVLKIVAELTGGEGADLILGGIPCEWLSVCRHIKKAGQEEIEAERRTLDSVLDLVNELDPRWWCLEDVRGIVKELPLSVPWVVIDAAEYSPQRRKRVYVGQFPVPAKGSCRDTLSSRLRPGPYRIGRRTFDRVPVRRRNFNKAECYGAEFGRKAPTILTQYIMSQGDGEMVVVDPSLPGGKRQLDWQEGAALQGFPNDYLFWGSPTDVANMVGRAIQIDTGRAILKAIVREAQKGRSASKRPSVKAAYTLMAETAAMA